MSELLYDFVYETVKLLVDKAEEVKIDISVSTKSVIFQIHTAEKDRGKIIGKQGRTIEGLKTITLAIKKTHFPDDARNVILEVLEEENQNFYNNKRY